MCCGLWFVVVGGVCSAGVSNALDFGGNKKSESPRSESPKVRSCHNIANSKSIKRARRKNWTNKL